MSARTPMAKYRKPTNFTCDYAIRLPQPSYGGDTATLCGAPATAIRLAGAMRALCADHAPPYDD